MNHKKTKITLITFSTISTAIIVSSSLTSCATSYQFVFGNFQSYINPDVAKRIQEYIPNINWQYYSSNDQILTYLVNKTFNTTIATNNMIAKLADKKLIKKIDWAKFEILTADKKNIVKSGNDFKGIMSDIVFRIATEGFREFNVNLLDYCFPYFAQDYVFVYRGKEIKELSGDNVTFTDIFKVLNNDSRFWVQKQLPQVMMIKDSRTTFDLAKILKQEKELTPNNQIDINPTKGLYNQPKQNSFSVQEFDDIYNQINNSITNNRLLINLNSDSNVLINKIVLNEINGAFMYNGDAVFAGIGGDYAGKNYNNKYIPYPTANDFHIVKPKNTLFCIDGVVLNSENNTEQLNTSLKLSYDLCLSGVDVKNFNDWNKNFETNKNINLDPQNLDIETEVDNEYLFLPMQNFDYVNYTPSLNKIYNLVSDPNSVYFKDVLVGLWYPENTTYDSLDANSKLKVDLLASELAKTIRISLDPNIDIAKHIELPLNNLTESNMTVAFTTFINNLQG